MSKNPRSLRVYLTLSLIASAFVGILVLAATNYRQPIDALVWAGITFIVVLVAIATLALSVKDENNNPDEPRLK